MNEDYDSLKQTIQSYNSLLGLEGYLENHGLDFKIWKGDQLNLENLCAFYDLIGETFKREVGSKLYKEAALNS